MVDLLNWPMHDGSRQFGELPQVAVWHAMRDHVLRLPGAAVTGFLFDTITEAWIDFTYAGHKFSVSDQFGAYLFFVADPTCPDDLLGKLLEHFGKVPA